MNIKGLWLAITNLGIEEESQGREVIRIRLLNQLMFISLMTSFLIIFTYIFDFQGYVIIITTIANMTIEFLGLYFAHKKKHRLARFMATFVFPTQIAISVLLVGGGFGEANIFTALAFAAFILYEGERLLQITAVAYSCLLFIGSKLYIIQNGLVSTAQKPYDEIITFPIILIVLGLIILIYQRELKIYEEQKLNLIKDLEQKNEELIETNSELEQFTYIASHDLKTPLRTISSHLDLIRFHLKKNDMEAVEEDIDFAKKGAKQLYNLVTDILEYKGLSYQDDIFENLNLNETLKKVLENFDTQKANIQYETLPTVTGRERDFIVLFQNMIENGLKYNESKNPHVSISSETTSEHFIIIFEDNGIGISEEYHEKIFQFFKRLHTHEEYEGTGIGLGLCQKIIKYYNGTIEVESTENQGSTFKVYLPVEMVES
jgi:signal transduction histidine kinase